LSISALFLATAAGSALIGASEQLIGLAELFAGPFGYCGASGPITLPLAVRLQIDQTGTAIGDAFRLRGLFGIDFVLAGDAAWPTEVNPRYPASVEVYESVIDLPLLEWHARACLTSGSEPDAKPVLEQFRAVLDQAESFRAGRTSTKAIVYSPFDFAAPDLVELARSPVFTSSGVQIADRPQKGSLMPEKAPVCTLLATEACTPGLYGLSGALAALVDAFGRNRVAG
jgi:predicted ATP-grasp superfamily ATP-dependent carboligase